MRAIRDHAAPFLSHNEVGDTMAGTLNRQYVEEHLGAHNYESFGRSIVAAVMEEALDQMSEEGAAFDGGFRLDVETVLEATGSGCTWLVMIVNGRRVRIHQPPIMSY